MRLYVAILLLTATLNAHFNSKPIELGEKNWQRLLDGQWMVQFVAPWCMPCKDFAPLWTSFARTAAKYDVQVAFVDITKSPSLSGRFLVTSLPTIYHIIDGKFRYYSGKRDYEALTNFIKQKQWQSVEPVSAWANPNSMHMGVLSYIFRLPFILQAWNALLKDQHDFKMYGTYGLFVLGAVLFAGILGLVSVVFLGFIWTSKKPIKCGLSVDIKKHTRNVNKANDVWIASDGENFRELAEEEEQIEDNCAGAEEQDEYKDENIYDVGNEDDDVFIIEEDDDDNDFTSESL